MEEKFTSLSAEDKTLFIVSMLNSAYELNKLIPNIEMVFFKMFISPITTMQERKRKDGDDLLAGNLFFKQDFKMPKQAYESLL